MKKNTKGNSEKVKFRRSAEWRDFRLELLKQPDLIDPISHKKLPIRSTNIHHLSDNKNFYTELNKDRYVAVSSTSHDVLHYLYNIYKREGNFDFLYDIEYYLRLMEEFELLDEWRETHE